jgi:BirA family transcriptional regulator, biotin operon repressor / biotin---[acetyl-CoA-carboxylase] ligase
MNAPGELPADLAAAFATHADRLRPFGTRVLFYPVVTSTSDVAAALASGGAADGTVVLADEQTHGRGRTGRRWHSPAGAGLYLSAVLRPVPTGEPSAAPDAWPSLLTLAAGVALAEGLRGATGLPVQIKWPNDVVLVDQAAPRASDRGWRKLAGILAEGSAQGGAVEHVVLGIGINLRPATLPAAIASQATSIEHETGRSVDRGLVLVEILAALSLRYRALTAGETEGLIPAWRALSPLAHGARVAFDAGGSRREGLTAGIDERGRLLVRAADGTVAALRAGEVTWL